VKVILEVPGESETKLRLHESIESARAAGDRWVAEHDTTPDELASWTRDGAFTPRILNENGDCLAARMPSGRWALSLAGQYAARVEECEATIARLAPLIRYARHYGACESTKEPWPGVIDGPLPCTCGLNAVIGAIGSAHVDKMRKEATACAGSAGDTPGKPADDQTPEHNHRGERRENGSHAAVVPPPGSAAATSGDNAPAVFKTADGGVPPVPSPPHGPETGGASLRALVARLTDLDERASRHWRRGSTETWHVFTPSGATMAPELGRVLLRFNEHFEHDADAELIVEMRNSLHWLLDAVEFFLDAHDGAVQLTDGDGGQR
jgi:hypothetical protein